MKKRLGLSLVCIMMVMLCACGGKDSGTGGSGKAADGYTFSNKSVEVKMDASAEKIIEALGSNYEYFEAASCAFKGLDKTYKYGSAFTIGTYPKDGKDYISYVYLNDDSVATQEGIKVGDTIDAMKKVYTDAKEDETGGYSCAKGNMSIKFISTDGTKIDEIDYVSNVTKSANKTK